MNDLHVIPCRDLLSHENSDGTPDENCACVPTVLVEDEGFIIVHHAWDGRVE